MDAYRSIPWVFVMFILVIVVSQIIVFVHFPYHGIPVFALSRDRPWGIITSWLAHTRPEHISYNITYIGGFSMVIVFLHTVIVYLLIRMCNMRELVVRNWSRMHDRLIVLNTMLAHIVPSIGQYIRDLDKGVPICGSSLMAFGLFGCLFPLSAYLITIPIVRMFRNRIRTFHYVSTIIFSILLMVIIVSIQLNSENFLKVMGYGSPRANVRGHIMAFACGLIIEYIGLSMLNLRYFKRTQKLR